MKRIYLSVVSFFVLLALFPPKQTWGEATLSVTEATRHLPGAFLASPLGYFVPPTTDPSLVSSGSRQDPTMFSINGVTIPQFRFDSYYRDNARVNAGRVFCTNCQLFDITGPPDVFLSPDELPAPSAPTPLYPVPSYLRTLSRAPGREVGFA